MGQQAENPSYWVVYLTFRLWPFYLVELANSKVFCLYFRKNFTALLLELIWYFDVNSEISKRYIKLFIVTFSI